MQFFSKKAAALQQLQSVLDKYLECPTLLDPFLEAMVTKLVIFAQSIVHEHYRICTNSSKKLESIELYEQSFNITFPLSALQSLCKVRGRKKIQKFLTHQVDDLEPVLFTLRYLQDPRVLLSHFKIEKTNVDSRYDCVFPAFWESTFILITWLEVLTLLPFDLSTLDSSITQRQIDNNTDEKNDQSEMTLMESIIQTCKHHLTDTGPTREAAASCLARLLTRPDLEKEEALENFVENYAAVILNHWEKNQNPEKFIKNSNKSINTLSDGAKESEHDLLFLVLGVIETLVHVFKTGARTNLINLVSCMETIWEHCILLAHGYTEINNYTKKKHQPMVLRKLLVKLFARVGCAHLKPRVAEWRYERGCRSLLENLSNAQIAARNKESLSNEVDCNFKNQEIPKLNSNNMSTKDSSQSLNGSYFFLIPAQIEDTTGLLLQYLRDPSTNIRYTAAKNIGRITERLPQICSQDILDAIFQLFESYGDNDTTSWHGGCLALAELARRGLLLPDRIDESVKVVLSAMKFDRQKHSLMVIGAQVRDAACYVCWAFARAYSSDVLAPYIRMLTERMLCTALFDRELNCRRAASAAFQEFVGRIGGRNIEFGIEILTMADYFALGNRENAYRKVALQIAKLGSCSSGYRRAILDSLGEKVCHWDVNIRILASKALGDVCILDTIYVKENLIWNFVEKCTDIDLNVRHGAIHAVAEIVLALGGERLKNNDKGPKDAASVAQITELVAKIERQRLYRGRGGEITRVAVARLTECISIAKLKLIVKQQVRLLDSVDDHLKHPKEDVQNAGVASLYALTRTYFPVGKNGPSERLQKRIVDNYIQLVSTSENVAFTRGFALALGSLPNKLLAPSNKVLQDVIDCLCDAARKDQRVGHEPDAETRRNSIVSLSKITQTVGIGPNSSACNAVNPMVCLDKNQVNQVFNCLLSCMDDYNTDRRGDVGSWSRIAAMTALEELVILSVQASTFIPQVSTLADTANLDKKEVISMPSMKSQTYFDDTLCVKVIRALLKQLAEKLDAVRLHGGCCLQRLLQNKSTHIPFIPQRAKLMKALRIELDTVEGFETESINWANPAITFPLIMQAANIPPLFEAIISGMIISIGGLTESVVRHSKAAMINWIKLNGKTQGKKEIIMLGDVFIDLFVRHSKNGRVISPLLKTLEHLLSQGCLNTLLSQDCKFSLSLLSILKIETNMCTDVQRIFGAVGVLVALLTAEDRNMVQDEVFPFIMKFLNHRYPRVRVYTAEQLYIKLVEDDGVISNSCPHFEDAMSLLLEAIWGGEDVREERNKVAEYLGIKLSLKESNASTSKTRKNGNHRLKDEFESYMSLVQDSAR